MNIRKQSITKKINYKNQTGIDAIQIAWSNISEDAKQRAWKEFIKIGKESILETSNNINLW